MQQIIPLVLVAIAGLIGGFVIGQLTGKKVKVEKPKEQKWLYVQTETVYYFGQCEVVEGGIKPVDIPDLGKDWVITDGMVLHQIRLDSHQMLYVVFVKRVPLLGHRDIDRLRQGMLVRSTPAVKPGGDSLNVLKFVATALPLFLAVYIAYQMITVTGTIQALNAQVVLLQDTLEKGVPIKRE